MQGKEGGRSLRHPKCSPFGLELAGGQAAGGSTSGKREEERKERQQKGGGGRAVGKAEREALAGRPHSSPPTPAGGRHVGKARVWGSGNLLQNFGPGGHLPSPRLSFPTSKVGVRYLVCRGAITFVKRPGTAEGLNKWLPLEQMPNSKGFGKVSVLGPIRRGPLRTRGDGLPSFYSKAAPLVAHSRCPAPHPGH